MGRFSVLELEDESRESKDTEQPWGEPPKDAAYFLDRAVQAYMISDYEEALQLFSKLLEFDPTDKLAWAGQVKCLISLSEFKEAVMWADKGMEAIGSEVPELLAAKSVACCRMGDGGRAYGYSDASLEQKGNSPYVWLCRGEVLLQHKKKNAETCLQKAITFNENSWETILEAAKIFSFYNKNSKAVQYIEKAINIAPTQPVLWFELGNCYIAMGLKAKSIEAYERCLELNEEFKAARKALGNAKNMGFLHRLKNIFH